MLKPKPKLKERHLEIFRVVMATNSLTAAARHLGLSQPNLSIAIKRLEDQLGVALFARISGRMVPTEEALLILKEVEHVHQQSEMLSDVVYAIAQGKGSTFRFGATPSLGMRLLPKALRQLQLKGTASTYYCDSLSQRDIRDYLLFGQGACVATIAEVEDPLLETVKIGEAKLVCVVPAHHALASRSSVTPRDLAGETLISFAAATTHGLYIDETFHRWGAVRETSVFVHFVEAALAYVAEGIGITILDTFSAMDCTANGLVAIPVENSVAIPAYVHSCRLRPRPSAAGVLIEELRILAASASSS
ncbi:LysR family transcriptional regulator [Rhizobium halophilum]|uniref:LysR family transcriptional regulator n=1 Tax=Rhizobium halophilum TaxID=2846852 RepID=UPI001EFE2F9F|nr:LysR family transcriptional regulator [Rhizobium halophilum]MCF6370846.1 LysR family transcriptional regulator [Rhizobium halophilum]